TCTASFSYSLSLSFFLFSCPCPHRALHSFPTRRSSDLRHAVARVRRERPQRPLRAPVPARPGRRRRPARRASHRHADPCAPGGRSEEHTSELQSRENLVCRLLLEKKNTDLRSIKR